MKEKNVKDNKQFWRTVKPLLSDKIKSLRKFHCLSGIKSFLKNKKMKTF